MSQLPGGPQSPAPIIPDDFQIPAEMPSWPKVVGIISIVWGSLGLVCGVWGIGAAFQSSIMSWAQQQNPQMANNPAFPGAPPGPLQYAAYGFGILVAIVLLTAGIQTVRRTPLGRTLHLIYAVVALLSTFVGVYAGWSQQQAQIAVLKGSTDQFAQQQLATAQMAATFGVACGGILGLAYPFFCLIWFGAVKRGRRT